MCTFKSIVVFVTGFLLLSCSNKPKSDPSNQLHDSIATTTAKAQIQTYNFPYDLKNPSEKFKVPGELKEISGIDRYKKTKLVCVQDEKGIIYEYDIKKGELKKSVDFGKKGDYEGVANVNDTIYVLESNGNIFQVIDLNSENQRTQEFNTPLNKDNDTEGLCFDSKNNRLLIACKKKAGAGIKNARAIYAFDLKTKQLNESPVYLIDLDEVKSYIAKSDPGKFLSEELKDLSDPKKGDVAFQPSELAIHPISGDIYVIATVGKMLIVLNPAGKIMCMKELDPDLFKQPEGITFMDDGTMLISDEGRGGHGNILKFNYHPNEK